MKEECSHPASCFFSDPCFLFSLLLSPLPPCSFGVDVVDVVAIIIVAVVMVVVVVFVIVVSAR